MRKVISLIFICFSLTTIAQRIIPQSLRWNNAVGFYSTALASTAYRLEAPNDGAETQPRIGYGGAIKLESALNTTRRIEAGAGVFWRSYQYTNVGNTKLFAEDRTINTTFLHFYLKHKWMMVTRYNGYYFAPGITLDVEMNHPIVHSDASGIGAAASFGFERRLKGGFIFFSEVDLRLPSLWHFKTEEYPWRHSHAGLNIGFMYIIR